MTYITSSPVALECPALYTAWYSVFFLIDGNLFICFQKPVKKGPPFSGPY